MKQGRVGGARIAALSIAGLLAVGIAACGDDSDETSTEEAASAEEVTLTATEYEFDLSATPTAETTSVTFQNDGAEDHVLIFAKINEGFTVDEAIELEGEKGSAEVIGQAQAKPGAAETVSIDEPLEPGAYAMLCPLQTKDGESHAELGQLEEFGIE